MLKFISRYRDLVIVLPIIYILGNIFAPLSYLVALIIMGGWARKGKNEHLIIFFLLVLILGDSRAHSLFFVKNLRVVVITFLSVLTSSELIRGKYRLQTIFLLSIPFFISASISGLRSPNIVLSYSKLISYLLLLFVAFHYLQFHIKKSRDKLTTDILYLASWIYLLGLIFIVLNPSLVFLKGRYRGLLGNPNGIGLYSFFIFSFAMVIWHLHPHRRKMIIRLMILLFISVILSGSRNALGSILIFLFIYKLYRGKPIRRGLFWFILLPFTILFLQIISIEDLVNMVGLGEYLRVESITTGTGRYLAWTIGWGYIQEYLWLGGGFAYEEIMFFELKEFLITTEHQGGLHNSYLTIIMNTGIIGFFLLIGFFTIILRRTKPAFLSIPLTITALLSANFESWLAASLNAFTIHFLLIIILLTHYYSLRSKRKIG